MLKDLGARLFFDVDDGEGEMSGEKRLLIAILDRAIRDLDPTLCRHLGTQTTARRWFLCEVDGEEIFSFEQVCDLLELCPGSILRYLKKLGHL